MKILKAKKAKPIKAHKPVKEHDEMTAGHKPQPDLIDNALASNQARDAGQPESPVIPEDKVGAMLKTTRLKKKLELDDIAQRLCIRKMYLDAIENSDYEDIPEYPYGPGFVRSYADFLGLNGERLVQVFKEETSCKAKDDQGYCLPEPQVEVVTPTRKYIVISLILIVAVYLAWMFWNQYSALHKDTNLDSDQHLSGVQEQDLTATQMPLAMEDYTQMTSEPDLAESADSLAPEVLPVVEVPEEVSASNPQVTVSEESFYEEEAPVEEPKAEASNLPKGVFIKVNQEAWVEVRDNEKLYLSKVLKPGDTYTLPNGGKNMRFSVGRYGAVEVFVNGVLTEVATPDKKTNIDINPFLSQN